MTFRRRNYPEVLDNLLTQIVGGVAAETHPYPPPDASGPPYRHHLEQPRVRQIVSAYGIRNGESRLFRNGTDYQFSQSGQTLEWLADGQPPDEGTLFHVNYLREDQRPSLTDLQVGSVARTITESIALEIARLYAQLEAAYKAGFVDTATGSSLDKVVALLDIARIRGDRPTAKLRFSRATGTPGSITIPAGIRVMDEQAKFEYETTQAVTMAENQNSITASARDLEPGNEPVEADVLKVLAVPIAGISAITNPAPAARANVDETDTELRTRAKHFLHGSERATLGALEQVFARQQVKVDVEEVSDTPGLIRVTPHAANLSPERTQQLLADLEAARPAGVLVVPNVALPPLEVDLEIELTTASNLPEPTLRAAHAAVRETVADYFARLPVRKPASINQIVGRILSVPGVEDVSLVRASVRETVDGVETQSDRLNPAAGLIEIADVPTVLGDLGVADPNLPTAVDLVVGFPETAAVPDAQQIETALTAALAYLNTLAETPADPNDVAEVQKRTLSFGKLLRVIPLPAKPGESLQSFDTATPQPALPEAASIADYRVALFISQANGLTRTLTQDGDSYVISASERLQLQNLDLTLETPDG